MDPLIVLVSGTNYPLLEATISALVKLGKDHPLCKIDIVKAWVVGGVLEVFLGALDSVYFNC